MYVSFKLADPVAMEEVVIVADQAEVVVDSRLSQLLVEGQGDP